MTWRWTRWTEASFAVALLVTCAAAPGRAAEPEDGDRAAASQPDENEETWSLIQQGRYVEAEASAREEMQANPWDAGAHNALAAIFYMRRDFVQTEIEGSKAIELAPEAPNYLSSLAGVDVILGHLAHARARIGKALRLSPDSWRAQRELAFIDDVTGHEARAVQMARAALETKRKTGANGSGVTVYPELDLEDRGLAAEAQRDTEEARAAWTELDRLEQAGELHVACLRGRGAAHLTRLNAAASPVTLALGSVVPVVEPIHFVHVEEPRDAAPYLALGEAMLQQGRIGEAIASLQRALDINPKHVPALMLLGRAYLLQHDLFRGRVAFEGAADAAQNAEAKALADASLAQVDTAEGRLEQAEAHLDRALALAPEHPDAYYGLALLYDATGREAAAKTMEHYALASDPEGAWLRSNPFADSETQLAETALAAESVGDNERARVSWIALNERERAGRFEASWLRGRAAAHLAQTEVGVAP
jgi:tetratricopeptide (TPR) repeat protein